MERARKITKALFLLCLPFSVVIMASLWQNNVRWFENLFLAGMIFAATYLLIICPNTISYVVATMLPVALLGWAYLSVLLLWNTPNWPLIIGIILATRALAPIAFSKQIEELRNELRDKSEKENKPLMDGLKWLLNQKGKST